MCLEFFIASLPPSLPKKAEPASFFCLCFYFRLGLFSLRKIPKSRVKRIILQEVRNVLFPGSADSFLASRVSKLRTRGQRTDIPYPCRGFL